MRVQMLDPSAFTPPYDHALCAALARSGAEVELITSRFLYGPVPREHTYAVSERFYRRTAARGLGGRGRRALKLAEHLPDMVRLRSHLRSADVVHWQWLTVPWLDLGLAPRRAPRAYTVHYPLPEGRLGVVRERALLGGMDAVIIHSEAGARRLRDEVGLDPERVHVVPHGAFDYLTRLDDERPLPDELAAAEGPVILCFGLIRPYKGIDVLIEACRDLEGVELWIVGMARMPVEPLRELASRCRATVRLVPRFVTDPEIPAFFRRADLVVLPYRRIEQSGVLYTALAFGKPIVASEVGMARMPVEPLRELASRCRATVRLVPRFVTDPEIPAFFRRADLVVLPYRRIEQSGVLYTALAFGKPIVASDVGGFAEVASAGGVRLVPPGDPAELAAALAELLGDDEERIGLGESAARLARSEYSWDSIAERTLEIYRGILR